MNRVFFTDRDLGKQFPQRLRDAGLAVGRRGWVVITHDERIRYKANELTAVVQHRVAMLLEVGRAPFPVLAQYFVQTLTRIQGFVDEHKPPCIAKVQQPTQHKLARRPDAPGTI